jgi:hypothetical protein
MNILLAFLGALLIALGVAMHGNRAGYWIFVVGSRTVVVLAACAIIGAFYAFR